MPFQHSSNPISPIALRRRKSMSDEKDGFTTPVGQGENQDLQVAFATESLEHALVQLAANLMRVVRGAGKPNSIFQRCIQVLRSAEDFKDMVGVYPSSFDIDRALHLEFLESHGNEFQQERAYERERMVSGAIQLAASTLLSQRLQIIQGEREMVDAARRLEESFERKRKEEQKNARINAKKPSAKAKGLKR
jgi:hypothetical protein